MHPSSASTMLLPPLTLLFLAAAAAQDVLYTFANLSAT